MSGFEDADELLEDFREESRGALESCESALLLTEREATFQEGYAEVFRAFHSIKGLSSMFGLDQIQAHFHHLESLLVRYKDQPRFDGELVDYFLSAVDAAYKMVEGSSVVFDLYDPLGGEEGAGKQEKTQSDQVEEEIPNLSVKEDVISIGEKQKRRDIIYVVDDEEDLLEIYCEILAELDCDIVPFGSAKEAMNCLDCTTAIDHPSVILSDLQMPEMSGTVFLEQVKAMNSEIPFIFLSGYLDRESADFGLANGAHGVLTKPVNDVELLFAVSSALAFYRSQRLVRKSLKFLFCFLSQSDSGHLDDKKVLENEIKALMNEMDNIKNRSKKAA